MSAQILDGKALSAEVREEVRMAVREWTDSGHHPPFLSVVLVGNDPASASYVRGKEKDAAEVGIESDTLRFGSDITEEELLKVVHDLNADDSVDGVLVQLPLPGAIDERKVIGTIDPRKDVDGFHPENLGQIVIGAPRFVPATPFGIVEMLERVGIETSGKDTVIVGRSNIVGKPLANLLMQRGTDATVTVCHSRTHDLAAHTRRADLLVAAVGQPAFITAEMVKEGAVVVDVGINRVEDASRDRGYRLVGDVDFEAVREKASWITPVPGGVGLMTRAMLLKNTLRAARQHRGTASAVPLS